MEKKKKRCGSVYLVEGKNMQHTIFVLKAPQNRFDVHMKFVCVSFDVVHRQKMFRYGGFV